MRPVALGRKNWIHVGANRRAESGGPPVHCGKLPPAEDSDPGIPGWRLPGLADRSFQRLAELTPGVGGGAAIGQAAAPVNPGSSSDGYSGTGVRTACI